MFWWLLYVMVRLSESMDHVYRFQLLLTCLLWMCWCLIRLTNECQSTDGMLGTFALQPVAWLAMGILAIFRLKIGGYNTGGLMSYSLPVLRVSGGQGHTALPETAFLLCRLPACDRGGNRADWRQCGWIHQMQQAGLRTSQEHGTKRHDCWPHGEPAGHPLKHFAYILH